MIFLELFLTFFKIGAFTFGGGYAMLPLIQEEVAIRWGDVITSEAMINFIAVSESTPGPFAVNMATYVGSQMGGILGAACATLGVVMPSFLIILIVAKCYEKFKTNRIVKGCMSGLKPAVVGLIATATLDIVGTVFALTGWSLAIFSSVTTYVSLAIFALCAVLAFKKVHPILIICIAAVIGIATGYLL